MAKSIANASSAASIDMTPVRNLEEALQLMQRARANAPAFCTNFFLAPARIQEWIDNGTLFHQEGEKSVLLFRKDRDFLHLHFAAPSPSVLPEEIKPWAARPAPPIVADLVGTEKQLNGLPIAFRDSGFRSYARLVRLSLPADRARELAKADGRLELGKPADRRALMNVLE